MREERENESDFLTVREVSKMLRVSRITLYHWIRVKFEFPKPHKIGGRYLWKEQDIDDYINLMKFR
jgi:excisionase family DNA binding protein